MRNIFSQSPYTDKTNVNDVVSGEKCKKKIFQ